MIKGARSRPDGPPGGSPSRSSASGSRTSGYGLKSSAMGLPVDRDPDEPRPVFVPVESAYEDAEAAPIRKVLVVVALLALVVGGGPDIIMFPPDIGLGEVDAHVDRWFLPSPAKHRVQMGAMGTYDRAVRMDDCVDFARTAYP